MRLSTATVEAIMTQPNHRTLSSCLKALAVTINVFKNIHSNYFLVFDPASPALSCILRLVNNMMYLGLNMH